MIHLRYAGKASIRIQPEGHDSLVLKPLGPDIEIKGADWKVELEKGGAYAVTPQNEVTLGCDAQGCDYTSAVISEDGVSLWPTVKGYHGEKQVTTFRIGNGQEVAFHSTVMSEVGVNVPEGLVTVGVYGLVYILTGYIPESEPVPVGTW